MRKFEKVPESITIAARVDGGKYRNAEELVSSPDTPVRTMSDFIRHGFDLALIDLALQTRDPWFVEMAEAVQELKKLEARQEHQDRLIRLKVMRSMIGDPEFSSTADNRSSEAFDPFSLESGPE